MLENKCHTGYLLILGISSYVVFLFLGMCLFLIWVPEILIHEIDLELWAQVGLSMDSWSGAEATSSFVLFVWQKDMVANVNTDIRAS